MLAWRNHYLRQGDKEVVDVGLKEPLPEARRQRSCGCCSQGTITWGRETMKLWMLFSRNHYLRQGDKEVVDVVLKEPLPEAGRQRSCGCCHQGTITWGRETKKLWMLSSRNHYLRQGDNEVVDVVFKEPLLEAGRQWSCGCCHSRNHYLRQGDNEVVDVVFKEPLLEAGRQRSCGCWPEGTITWGRETMKLLMLSFKEPLPEVGRQRSCGCCHQGTITWGRETMKLWMLSSRNHYLRQGDNEVVDVVFKEPLPEVGRQWSCGCWASRNHYLRQGDKEVVDVVLKEPLPEAGRQRSCGCWPEGTITWGRETMKLWMLSSRNHYLRQGDNEVVDVVLKEPLPETGRQRSCGCCSQGTITWGRETMKLWMLFSRNHYLRQGDKEVVDVVLKEPLPETGRQRSCGCCSQGTITWGRETMTTSLSPCLR